MLYTQFMPLFWLIVAVILGVAEAVTIDLVAIWFSVGAIAAIIPAWLKFPVGVQVAVFTVVSIGALIVSKPFSQRILNVKTTRTNADSIIGMMGTVTENIENSEDKGRIHINGLDWKALSDDGSPIEKGERVIVKEIKGVTVIVERI